MVFLEMAAGPASRRPKQGRLRPGRKGRSRPGPSFQTIGCSHPYPHSGCGSRASSSNRNDHATGGRSAPGTGRREAGKGT